MARHHTSHQQKRIVTTARGLIAQAQFVEAFALVLAFAVNRDDHHAETLTKVDFAQGFARNGGVGRNHRFYDGALIGGDRFKVLGKLHLEGDAFLRAGRRDTGGMAGHHETIARLERDFAGIILDRDPVAHDFKEADAARFQEAAFGGGG